MFTNSAHYVSDSEMSNAISSIETDVRTLMRQVHSIQRHCFSRKTKKNADGSITHYMWLAKRPSKDFDIEASIREVRNVSESLKENIRLIRRYQNSNNSNDEMYGRLLSEEMRHRNAESLLMYIRSIFGTEVFNRIKKDYEKERERR